MYNKITIIITERYDIKSDKQGGKPTHHKDILGTVNLSGNYELSEINELVTALIKPFEFTLVHVEIKLEGSNQ